MTNWCKRLITAGTLVILVLFIPVLVAAQTRSLCRETPPCQDQTVFTIQSESTYATAARLRKLSYRISAFERMLEHELNSRDLYNSSGKIHANLLMTRFKDAAETLQSRYEIVATLKNSRTEARNLLRVAEEVDDLIHRTPLSRPALRSWNAMKQEIALLALPCTEAARKNPDSETDVGPAREYQSAASSYSRIWRF